MTKTEYVVLQPIDFGRSHRAIPKLTFTTSEAAQAYIDSKINERYRDNYFVRSRPVKADKLAKAMHCQCCGRAIFAETGTIAHHGYQRPGHGWQTASCFGAKHLPWEVDRAQLAVQIDYVNALIISQVGNRNGVANDEEPVTKSYSVYDKAKGRSFGKEIHFDRNDFALVRNNPAFVGRDLPFQPYDSKDFEDYKRRDLEIRDSKIKSLKRDVADMEKRYASWKQTHTWANDAWVKLDPTSINNGD